MNEFEFQDLVIYGVNGLLQYALGCVVGQSDSDKLEGPLGTDRGQQMIVIPFEIAKQWPFKMYKTKVGQLSSSTLQNGLWFVEEDDDT